MPALLNPARKKRRYVLKNLPPHEHSRPENDSPRLPALLSPPRTRRKKIVPRLRKRSAPRRRTNSPPLQPHGREETCNDYRMLRMLWRQTPAWRRIEGKLKTQNCKMGASLHGKPLRVAMYAVPLSLHCTVRSFCFTKWLSMQRLRRRSQRLRSPVIRTSFCRGNFLLVLACPHIPNLRLLEDRLQGG